MDELYDIIDLFKIPGAEHRILGQSLSVSDNLDVDDIEPLYQVVKHKIIEKKVQYNPYLIGIVCVSGSITMEIDLKDYTIHAGDILVVTHRQIGNLKDITPDLRYFTLAINDSYYDPNINETDPNRDKLLINTYQHVHLPTEEIEVLMATYKIIKRKIGERESIYNTEVIKGLIQTYFFEIFSEIEKQNQVLTSYQKLSDDRRQQAVFIDFLKAVDEHCRLERSVKYYADMLCITPKYLSFIINKVSGKFAGDFIREAVVHEAKALIRSGKYSMLDISILLNFSTQSSFTRFFRNAVGMSPQEFQNKC